MVSSIGSSNINPVNMFNAVNAFKTEQVKSSQPAVRDVSDGMGAVSDTILKNQNLEEIKDIAKVAGEENITDNDIKYGLKYGRSVIADYIA